jgi:peptidase E
LSGCLGLLAGSFCAHYDGEPPRRPVYQRCVAEGTVAPGLAAADGCALHFQDTTLAAIVASRPQAHAYRVERHRDGGATETPLPARFLG